MLRFTIRALRIITRILAAVVDHLEAFQQPPPARQPFITPAKKPSLQAQQPVKRTPTKNVPSSDREFLFSPKKMPSPMEPRDYSGPKRVSEGELRVRHLPWETWLALFVFEDITSANKARDYLGFGQPTPIRGKYRSAYALVHQGWAVLRRDFPDVHLDRLTH